MARHGLEELSMTTPVIQDTTFDGPRRTITSPLHIPVLLAAFAIVATSAGCDLGGTRGEGAVETETRTIEAFSRIETSAGIGVSARIGPAGTLEVHAKGNVLPLIVTEVKDGTLRLRSSHGYTTSEKVDVVVTTTSLSRLALSGGSVGQVEGLKADSIDIELSGGSRLTATGQATDMSLGLSGGSVANLQGLSTGTIALDASGGSNATLQASERVHGSASGGTRITVFGDADLSVETTGNSTVNRS
jgi:hypothetical protein